MQFDSTHITVILDRSGSMHSIRNDVIGGFNSFLQEQKTEADSATLTLVQFDSVNPYELVHNELPLDEVPDLTRRSYVPRGTTPLLDALGRGIHEVEARRNERAGRQSPAKEVFAVITDGRENASREYRRAQVEEMVKEKTEKDGWQFVFLSADLSSIRDALSVGIEADAILLFKKSHEGTHHAWRTLSAHTSRFRRGGVGRVAFDPQDRLHPDDPMRKHR